MTLIRKCIKESVTIVQIVTLLFIKVYVSDKSPLVFFKQSYVCMNILLFI